MSQCDSWEYHNGFCYAPERAGTSNYGSILPRGAHT